MRRTTDRNRTVVIALLALILGLGVFTITTQPQLDAQSGADDDEEKIDLVIAATEALYRGKYREARSYAKDLASDAQERDLALWIDARSSLEGRDPHEAITLLEGAKVSNGSSIVLLTEYGYALQTVGRYQDALTIGEQLITIDGKDPRGYWIAGEALASTGEHDKAKARFTDGSAHGGNVREYQKGMAENWENAEKLYAAGCCAFALNDLHKAQDHFDNARTWHKRHTASWLRLARLFYETNKDESARGNYCQPVLDYNPNSAGANFWASLTWAFRWNGQKARESLDRAIRANRYYVPALAYRAGYFVNNQQFDKAANDVAAALAVNPNSLEALAAKAMLAHVLDKKEEFTAVEQHVASFNPRAGVFYQALADGLAGMFLFDDALRFYEKAAALQPDLWTIYQGWGRTCLNLGDIDKGKQHLETAFKNDLLRNNLFTNNLLELLGSYKNFTTIEDPQGRYVLRLHHSEVQVMGEYYKHFLDKTFDELTAKYDGFKPAKVMVEAFHVHRDFEVRTVGITGLPALGACFGKLVTLDSPLARDPGSYNWASTLRHEMDHVYQLQISHGQCPRWLAEGCSVYEERRCRPEWERHMEQQLYATYSMNTLPKVKEFNEWFGDSSRVLFAYYLASIMVEFIVENYGGYTPVIAMIQEFARHRTPDEVFSGTLQIDTDEFDRKFREHVGKKVGKIKLFPAIEVDQLDDLKEKAEDGDASPDELVKLARAQYQQGNASDARIWSGMAKKWGMDTKELSYLLGRLALTDPRLSTPEEQAKAEKEYLTKALNQGLEDYDLYMRMAQISQAEQNAAAVIFFLNEARRAFPTNPQPLQMLMQFYMQEQNMERAREIAEQLVMLNENDLRTRAWLLQRYEALGDPVKAADMALQMIWVAPYVPEPHRARAEALRELADYAESLHEWEMLRRVYLNSNYQGDDRVPGEISALIGMARTYLDMGDTDKAREKALDAVALDKNNTAAKALLEEIDGDDIEEHFE
ncbi:MAG: hypothetical protein HUU29_01945 [Planctomycetaceae bacterium]|nr:hypothetical protein [Planctomycetaceae bacterium]